MRGLKWGVRVGDGIAWYDGIELGWIVDLKVIVSPLASKMEVMHLGRTFDSSLPSAQMKNLGHDRD